MPDAFTTEISKSRFGEPAKFLPVVFVTVIISLLWGIYTICHCIPFLQDPATASQGTTQTIVFNCVALMLVTCYARSVFTLPGTIPDKDVEGSISPWEYVPQDLHRSNSDSPRSADTKETKRSGDRRYCKWCAKYKPDRCHHCRVCRTCILRMDHHCPWIYNCVGFRNHKFFFLLLFYSAIACQIIVWTMYGSLKAAITPETSFLTMFSLLFRETLAVVLGFMVTVFFCFHIWLMQKAMTTIEFCEKSMKRAGYDSSAFHKGTYGNMKAVLGDNIALWLLPCSPPSGDGLSYIDEEAPLVPSGAKDVEAGRDLRKRSHEAAPNKQRSKASGAAGTGELESDSSPEQDGALFSPGAATRAVPFEASSRWSPLEDSR